MKKCLKQLLTTKDIHLVHELIKNQSYDIAMEMKGFQHKDQVSLIKCFPTEKGAKILSYLTPEEQYNICTNLPVDKGEELLARQSIDDLVDVILSIHPLQAEKLIQLLSEESQQRIRSLLVFQSGTAGSLMTIDYIAARENWKVKDTLSHIRKIGAGVESISYIYVLDTRGQLNGIVSIRELLLASDDKTLSSIMASDVISVSVNLDQQEAVQKLMDYDLSAIPVTTMDNRMIGIITFDDAMDVFEEEATEDIQKLGGSTPLDKPYFETSIWQIYRKRIGWLLLLFVAEAYTGSVLRHYEETLTHVVALAFFIPLLIGTGGNTGTQVVTTLVRAVALNEVKFKDIFRVMKKEALVGLLLGLTLAVAALIRAYTLGVGTEVAQVVAITGLFIVIWSSIVSSVLPLILNKLKLDPAVISGPFITTLVDGTGLILYFTIAKMLLGL
ncbi:magnesium transporter [Bacillus wiedmannii]|uniref:magnesium transporter n=1 Tax=Bacillus wiedmannii TaxID=1890302 RepID=UPI000BEFDCED|nr:magnesium transporter [Bacillus wiedmannii]PEI34111.1 magnesium transporter [Bacillus wiedmannii]PEL98055.1 magnesium transporter [Bacillus wiedmannii]PEN99727.1 magnesium transporter [Bacillus wiedmannii]PFZ01195.1 magnesium transporter [Bacillus wiedmannii]